MGEKPVGAVARVLELDSSEEFAMVVLIARLLVAAACVSVVVAALIWFVWATRAEWRRLQRKEK